MQDAAGPPPVPDETREELITLLQRTGAVSVSKTKKFRLASGELSDCYFDLRLLCGDPAGIGLVARALGSLIARLNRDGATPGGGPVRSVGGLESGSISIATAISLLSGRGLLAGPEPAPPLSSFFVRKGRKEHGTGKLIEGVIRPPVVVVDDVITSGGSALAAVRAVRDAGYDCSHLLSIVFRGTPEQEERIREHVHLDYIFKASDIFARLRG